MDNKKKRTSGLRRFSRRDFVKASAIGAGGLVLGACAPKAPEAPTAAPVAGATPAPATARVPVTLKVWKGPHSQDEEARFQKYLQPFRDANPNINVEYRVTPWESWDEVNTTGFLNKELDVWYNSGEAFFKFAKAGQLADLAPYIDDPSYASDKAAFSEFGLRAGQMDGKSYCLPFIQTAMCMYFNVDMFNAAGISYPPKTYEQFVEAAKALTVPGKVWGFTTPLQNVDTPEYFNTQWFWQCGVDYLNEAMTDVGYDNECGLSVVQFFTDLVCKHKVTPPGASYNRFGLVDLFRGGKAAMMMDEISQHGSWKTSGLPPFKYDVGLQPAGPKGQFQVGGNGNWTIAEASEHKDEAWVLLKFLTSAAFIKTYSEDHGFMPARTDVKDIWVDDPIFQKAYREIAPRARQLQPHPKMREISRVIWLPFERAFNCEASPEAVLKESVTLVKQIMSA